MSPLDPPSHRSALPPPPRASLPPPPAPPPHAGPRPTARWGLGDAFASLGIFFATSFVVTLAAFMVVGDELSLSGPFLPIALLVPGVAQLLHVRGVARAKGDGLARDFAFRHERSDLALGVALGLGGLVLAAVVTAITLAFLPEPPSARLADLATGDGTSEGITVSLIAVAILASTFVPVIEELVYRGLWWSALAKRGLSERWVLVTTSAVFASVHLEPERFLTLFALGLALGYGRYRTGRLGPSIVAHAVINGISMIAVLASV